MVYNDYIDYMRTIIIYASTILLDDPMHSSRFQNSKIVIAMFIIDTSSTINPFQDIIIPFFL